MSIFFTKPIPRKALWGGKTLRQAFCFPDDFGDDIGQAWAFSAQPGQASQLTGGDGKYRTLDELWTKRPDLFRSRYNRFPFIISLVAPEDDLSMQVHPDDAHAIPLGYPTGKNEAWVFLKAPATGAIVYGHVAEDEEALRRYVDNGWWEALVRRLPVREGETVYIPAGVLHALSRGSVVYEIQQATDVTYRFYDYNRRDVMGQQRPVQLEEAISCLRYGDVWPEAKPAPIIHEAHGIQETICVSNDSFVVRKLVCRGCCTLRYPGYLLATVASGNGQAAGHALRVGQSFLLPADEPLTLDGNLTLLCTSEQ